MVFQRSNNAIHSWITLYVLPSLIRWIAIYLLDSIICHVYNWTLEFKIALWRRKASNSSNHVQVTFKWPLWRDLWRILWMRARTDDQRNRTDEMIDEWKLNHWSELQNYFTSSFVCFNKSLRWAEIHSSSLHRPRKMFIVLLFGGNVHDPAKSILLILKDMPLSLHWRFQFYIQEESLNYSSYSLDTRGWGRGSRRLRWKNMGRDYFP